MPTQAPVQVKQHVRRAPGTPQPLNPAQVYVIRPEETKPQEPIPKENRIKKFVRRLRPKRVAPPQTEMDTLADEAEEVARIIDGLEVKQ